MSSSDPQDKENICALQLGLKQLSLSPRMSNNDSSGKRCNKGNAEVVPSTLSLSHCSKSDIVKTINTRSKMPTVIRLNNVHLLQKSNMATEIKEEPDENCDEFVKLFSELMVSSVCSATAPEAEVSEVIQKRGKCKVKHSSSQPENHLPYVVKRLQADESLHKNLLHLSGGSVQCYSESNEIFSPVTTAHTEERSQLSPTDTIPEDGCLSPESGYGSPDMQTSSLPSTSSELYAEPLNQHATDLQNILDVKEHIPDEEKNDVLDDIMHLISKEDKDCSRSCQPSVTLIQPIYVFPLMTCLPLKKQPRTILPKLSNTDNTDNSRRNLLKCHLNLNDIHHIAKGIYLRKREDKKKRIICVEDTKTKRTNLHLAVIKQELEHVYCLVEIQIQFNQDWKNVAIAFNLEDIFRKTALDYAKEATLEQKLSLIAYLEKAGAKSKLKKQS